MQSTKVLALLISIVSFQTLQATQLTSPENSLSVKSDSVSKKTESWWGQIKGTFSSWMPSFKISASQPRNFEKHMESTQWWAISKKEDQSWAREWSQLVGHVADENARQTKILLTQMLHRKSEHLVGHQKGIAYYEGVAKEVKKSPTFIKEQDEKLNKSLEKGVGFFLTQLAEQADTYIENKNSDLGRISLVKYAQDLARFYQGIEQQELGLDQDYFDGDLFQQSHDYAKSLFKISQLDRRPENLPRLKSLIKELYTNLDGGKLSDLSQDTLNSLNIETDLPKARSSWLSSRTTGAGLIFLIASSGLITSAAAARPSLLDNFCSTSGFNYGFCESSFGAPIGFESQINSIKSNGNFQQIITDKILQSNRQNSIIDTIIRIGSMQSQFYGELISSRTDSFSDGNVTMITYFKSAPYLGIQEAPFSPTQYNRITFNMTNTADSSAQTTNSYALTAPIQLSYFGQIENSERMILALTPVNETSFVYGVVVDRPLGGTPKVIREGILTSLVRAIIPGSLISSPTMNNNNPSGPLPVESVDSLISSRFYSGNVAGTDGSNPRPITQYFEDIGFTTSSSFLAVKNCLASPGISPLGCKTEFAGLPGFTSSLYVYATQPNSVVTLSRNLLQGTNYTEATYQADSGNSFGISMNYDIQPVNTATRTNSTLPIPFSTLRGTLPLNQIEKFWIYNPDPANSELGYVVRTTQNSSGTSTSYYVVPGQGITTFPSTPSTPTGPTPTGPSPVPTTDTPQEPNNPTSPSGLSTTTIVAIAVPVGAAVLAGGIFGLVFGLKKSKENKGFKSTNNDEEMGNARKPTSSTALITRESIAPQGTFNPSAIGVHNFATTVNGSLNNNQYGLYFKVTEDEFNQVIKETGLKLKFTPLDRPGKTPKMDLILGGGNFGQVRAAKDLRTGKIVAVKIVPGTEKVKASLREGRLQHRLSDEEHVLPLLDYLHYTTSNNTSDASALLKNAFGNDSQKNEDLLLQFTPLATLGNGEDLSSYLSRLDGKDDELKDKIVTYVAHSFLTGLLKMHEKGMSHLDFKLGNLLVSWNGDVWVSDMGCAVQKTTISGGIGDFRYFSPERLKHLIYLNQKKKNPNAFKGDLRATFDGHKADDFAAGLSILDLILNEYPFQALVDKRKQGVSIPNHMIQAWAEETYEGGLNNIFDQFKDNYNPFFKVIRGLTAVNPKERLSTSEAINALEALLPDESGQQLFSQLDQRLQTIIAQAQNPQKPEEGIDLTDHYDPTTPGHRKYQKIGSDGYAYYKEFSVEESSSGEIYGTKLPIYQEMQQAYVAPSKKKGTSPAKALSADEVVYTDIQDDEKVTYTVIPDDEGEEATYTDFAQVATTSNPPPRNKGNNATPTEWTYQ